MMETKPFSLQSPEQIAKDYAGNKQKIAQAMQMGIVDPTAGTLAAMFIDRMRTAAQSEAAPSTTVAQDAFAPPQPSAGLGAATQPGMGAPNGGGQPLPSQVPAAVPQAPPAMAAGGLTTLPLPDTMFDEPDNGSYAMGGLVAFQSGGAVRPQDMDAGGPDIVVTDAVEEVEFPEAVDVGVPRDIYGLSGSPFGNLRDLNELSPQSSQRANALTQRYEQMLTPEEQDRRRNQDMWMTLGQIGARMATTPGSLLQAASTGIGEALPGVREDAAARRAEELGALQALAQQEGASNAQAREAASLALEMTKVYGSFAEAMKDRAFRDRWEAAGNETQILTTRIAAAAGITTAGIGAAAQKYGDDTQAGIARDDRRSRAMQVVQEAIGPNGGLSDLYLNTPVTQRPAFVREAQQAYIDGRPFGGVGGAGQGWSFGGGSNPFGGLGSIAPGRSSNPGTIVSAVPIPR